MDIINIYENYNSYFNDDLKSLFETLSKSAAKHGFKIYLIGGIVRDMLLSTSSSLRGAKRRGNPKDESGLLRVLTNPRNDMNDLEQKQENISPPCNNINFFDIDITVEGDAIEFANILKVECSAKINSEHKDFGTAKITINGINIDLASTRSESYHKQGHLPHVDEIGCALQKDVLRRDFTINSLALSLNQDSFAKIIDYVGGLEDLKAKKIKILHDKSFIDDPTRIIRALKYASRLNFKIDKQTFKLQEEYLANINYDMCYKRVKQEIKKTFDQNIQEAFDAFLNQELYKLITPHPSPRPSRGEGKALNLHKTNQLIKNYPPKHAWLVYFGVLSMFMDIEDIPLTKYEKEVIEGAKSLLEKQLSDDFEIYKAFGAQKLETLLILAVLDKEKKVCLYLDNLSKIKIHINGDDLIKLGLKPSKKFGDAFDYVLKAKLKNPKMTKAEEIELAKEFLIL